MSIEIKKTVPVNKDYGPLVDPSVKKNPIIRKNREALKTRIKNNPEAKVTEVAKVVQRFGEDLVRVEQTAEYFDPSKKRPVSNKIQDAFMGKRGGKKTFTTLIRTDPLKTKDIEKKQEQIKGEIKNASDEIKVIEKKIDELNELKKNDEWVDKHYREYKALFKDKARDIEDYKKQILEPGFDQAQILPLRADKNEKEAKLAKMKEDLESVDQALASRKQMVDKLGYDPTDRDSYVAYAKKYQNDDGVGKDYEGHKYYAFWDRLGHNNVKYFLFVPDNEPEKAEIRAVFDPETGLPVEDRHRYHLAIRDFCDFYAYYESALDEELENIAKELIKKPEFAHCTVAGIVEALKAELKKNPPVLLINPKRGTYRILTRDFDLNSINPGSNRVGLYLKSKVIPQGCIDRMKRRRQMSKDEASKSREPKDRSSSSKKDAARKLADHSDEKKKKNEIELSDLVNKNKNLNNNNNNN